eukprot:TRINITY_DN11069_c0_g1_i2.p1 TRINITY_DN11069_c0_g1~~TRINITY_DN11069_c0_g1_i2.p1  ORF type:complete len:190 (+),score=51.28 TRINITY_DN11069_c0_g1_i2:177-746(+)
MLAEDSFFGMIRLPENSGKSLFVRSPLVRLAVQSSPQKAYVTTWLPERIQEKERIRMGVGIGGSSVSVSGSGSGNGNGSAGRRKEMQMSRMGDDRHIDDSSRKRPFNDALFQLNEYCQRNWRIDCDTCADLRNYVFREDMKLLKKWIENPRKAQTNLRQFVFRKWKSIGLDPASFRYFSKWKKKKSEEE